VVAAAVTPTEAVALLDRMRGVAQHRFLADDVPLIVGSHLATERVATHRQVTDAHLLAVARRHGGRLVTLDRGVAALAGGEDVELVPLV
jgi:predicted nucleic acid-binding protein